MAHPSTARTARIRDYSFICESAVHNNRPHSRSSMKSRVNAKDIRIDLDVPSLVEVLICRVVTDRWLVSKVTVLPFVRDRVTSTLLRAQI